MCGRLQLYRYSFTKRLASKLYLRKERMHWSTRSQPIANQTIKIICIYKYTILFWKPLCKISIRWSQVEALQKFLLRRDGCASISISVNKWKLFDVVSYDHQRKKKPGVSIEWFVCDFVDEVVWQLLRVHSRCALSHREQFFWFFWWLFIRI